MPTLPSALLLNLVIQFIEELEFFILLGFATTVCERDRYWETDSHSAYQKRQRLLWNQKVNYRAQSYSESVGPSPHRTNYLPSGLFSSSGLPIEMVHLFLISPTHATFLANLILRSWSDPRNDRLFVKNTDFEDLPWVCIIFSSLMLHPPSQVQIFSSAPCSQNTLSTSISLSMREQVSHL